MAFIIVKPKRDSAFQRKHPWVFSGAVAKKKGSPAAGETVAPDQRFSIGA